MDGLVADTRKTRKGRTATAQRGRNEVGNDLNFLEFFLQVVSGGRLSLSVDPIGGLLDGVQEHVLVFGVQLVIETLRVAGLGLGLEIVDVGRQGVESFDALLLNFVLSGKFLSSRNHAVNLLCEWPLLVGDGDRLRFTGAAALIGGENPHDTVGVDLECDLDLGNTTRGGADPGEFEPAEEIVLLGQRMLTLEDLNRNGGLVVGGSGEDLTLAGGDDSVTGDELGHDTTSGLDTESDGVDIDDDDITEALITGEDTALNCGTIGNCLIRVDALGGLLSKIFLEDLLDLGDTSGTTDENYLHDMSVALDTTNRPEYSPIDILLP